MPVDSTAAIRYILHIAIWNYLWSLGIFLPDLVCRTKKNLATLTLTANRHGQKFFFS
jgi:hypothetical protein